jgi:hypothetical protein
MKQCTKCNETKELQFFQKNKRNKDGLHCWCKSCINEGVKKYFKTEEGKKTNKKSIQKYHKTEKYKQTHKSYLTRKQGIYEWFEGDISLYIGQSSWLYSRMCSHKSWLKNPETSEKSSQSYLYKALRQHQNVDIRIIEECLPELLLEREQYYIDTLKPLYNSLKIT